MSELARRKLLLRFVAALLLLAVLAALVGCSPQSDASRFNTDEWLAVVIGFFIGVVVAVKLVVLVIVVGAKVVMRWVMDHM